MGTGTLHPGSKKKKENSMNSIEDTNIINLEVVKNQK
jgi:hypothetical protein